MVHVMLTSASGMFIDFPIGQTIMAEVLHLSFTSSPLQHPLELAPGHFRTFVQIFVSLALCILV